MVIQKIEDIELNKINIVVGHTTLVDKLLGEFIFSDKPLAVLLNNIESNLHHTEVEDKLFDIVERHNKIPFIFTTQSKEVLYMLARLLENKPDILNTYNVWEDNGNLKVFYINQNDFINYIDTDNDLRE